MNVEKHGVTFDEAATVLLSETVIRFEDDHPDEERFVAVGYSSQARILTVIYCYRFENEIRIISARRATRKERELYEKGI
jgi:uncharacterized protein